MQLGMIGLGKMGLNIATRLMQRGHQVAAFDVNEAARQGRYAGFCVNSFARS